MKKELSAVAAEAVDWIKGRSSGAEAELYFSREEDRSVELRDGELEGLQRAESEGVGLRVLRDGRMGFACAGGIDLDVVKGLFDRALAQLGHMEPDSARSFPAPGGKADGADLEATLWDETLFSGRMEESLPRLREMEKLALSADKRVGSVLRVGYSESRGEVAVANTRGLLAFEKGSSASVGISALAAEGEEVQTGSAYQSSRKKERLEFEKVARQAGERAVALLGSRKLPGGRRAVIFDPWVAGEFLDLIAGLLSADGIQRGKSLLAGKLGSRVGSRLAEFRDDPRMKFGLGSSLYDDEGCLTKPKTMIEAGVVKEYFYDTYTANKDKLQSNASAGRGSFKGLPGPTSSNFFLVPGAITREALISDTKDGLLILDVMGMHMADSISGEFSVGVSGLAVESGRLTHPVKGAMISGNLLELLERMDAVADDLTFYGGLGSPTFRVADINVA